jgi:beta-phosphoglucomutase-like phosphatase (HAD superfamily)
MKLKKRKFKGVVFDFDGVLADTEGLQMEKWHILLSRYGITISLEEYIREYCGKSSATEIPELLKKRYGERIPYPAKELGELASEILENLFKTQRIELMPGARDALRFFRQKGFKMAVCSAKNPSELEMKLKGAKLLDWFPPENRSTQSEAGGLPKPDPAMYQLAVKRLGLKPEECIAFEDTSDGVKSAARAGLYVIAMRNKWTRGHDYSSANRVIEKGGWIEFLKNPQIEGQ